MARMRHKIRRAAPGNVTRTRDRRIIDKLTIRPVNQSELATAPICQSNSCGDYYSAPRQSRTFGSSAQHSRILLSSLFNYAGLRRRYSTLSPSQFNAAIQFCLRAFHHRRQSARPSSPVDPSPVPFNFPPSMAPRSHSSPSVPSAEPLIAATDFAATTAA